VCAAGAWCERRNGAEVKRVQCCGVSGSEEGSGSSRQCGVVACVHEEACENQKRKPRQERQKERHAVCVVCRRAVGWWQEETKVTGKEADVMYKGIKRASMGTVGGIKGVG